MKNTTTELLAALKKQHGLASDSDVIKFLQASGGVKNTTTSLLDAVKKKHSLSSDYQLGKFLALADSGISNYRRGRSQMSDDIAVKVAAALDMEPGAVLAMLAAERCKTDTTRAAWMEVAKRLGGVAASILLLIGGTGGPPSANAGSATIEHNQQHKYTFDRSAKKRRKIKPVRATRSTWLSPILRALSGSVPDLRPVATA